MRALHVSAELYPWVKSGGLGDVAAALPPALAAQGVEVRLLLPGFAGFLDAFSGSVDIARLRTPYAAERVRIARARLPGAERYAYLVDHPAFYDRPGNPYAGPDGADWPDNHRRFGLFGWAAAALARGVDAQWRPDLLHCHDWHGGLAPAYLAASPPPADAPVATVFTIHNLAYRGLFAGAAFSELALPSEFFAPEGLEFYGQVSLLKAGLHYSDRLTTVSPTYAREIQTPDFGWGLDGLLRRRANLLHGILNGVDPEIWDPGHDPNLPRSYGPEDARVGKRAAKMALQSRLGLAAEPEAPLFGIVSRLTWQKGLDLLLASVPGVATAGQLAVLGAGDRDLETGFVATAAAHPGRVAVEIGYDEALAHSIYAASDLVLVPSRFEPCGLSQLYALRYGALPLVRRVGGLADTVVDADAVSLAEGSATGFAFDEESPAALLATLERALGLMRQPQIWQRMMVRAMTRDFSWVAAARQYRDLYAELLAERATAVSL